MKRVKKYIGEISMTIFLSCSINSYCNAQKIAIEEIIDSIFCSNRYYSDFNKIVVKKTVDSIFSFDVKKHFTDCYELTIIDDEKQFVKLLKRNEFTYRIGWSITNIDNQLTYHLEVTKTNYKMYKNKFAYGYPYEDIDVSFIKDDIKNAWIINSIKSK